MGYDINIKREDDNNKISKQEWLAYIKSDAEFENIEELSASIENEGILTIPTPNAGLWKAKGRDVPFTFDEEYGEITVKNPDYEITKKMISIAKGLNAVVIGEEGEIYR